MPGFFIFRHNRGYTRVLTRLRKGKRRRFFMSELINIIPDGVYELIHDDIKYGGKTRDVIQRYA
jgi:hypothetical protein